MQAGYAARLRAAVLSDIHSNRPALEAVLAAVDEAGVDQVWCLGDVVGYGADPDACTALVRERCAVCLVGNHDLAVLGALDISTFSETAAAAVEWTRENVSAETLEFLAALEPAASQAGVGLFHASPRDPIWEYVLSIDQAEAGLDAQEERVGLIGHSHVALFFTRAAAERPRLRPRRPGGRRRRARDRRRRLAAQPRQRRPAPRRRPARRLAGARHRATGPARYHRVAYDIEAAAAAILAAGLPDVARRAPGGRPLIARNAGQISPPNRCLDSNHGPSERHSCSPSLLGAASAAALASCGGGSDADLLPGDDREPDQLEPRPGRRNWSPTATASAPKTPSPRSAPRSKNSAASTRS